mmetsp:Transcript_10264/g.15600  ORF Transcript_10264/g.15600 Transcript_10264/m.15600 type:complete len:367 (-) Transcript_10264:52-1152(-)
MYRDAQTASSDSGVDSEGVEGEVDGFIKNRPSIAELAASERAAEMELGSGESDGSDIDHKSAIKPAVKKREPSGATVIHSGLFLKQGQIRKNWKYRYFEILSNGVLVYKESKDSVFEKGRMELKVCVVHHVDVYVPASAAPDGLMEEAISSKAVSAKDIIHRHGVTLIRVGAIEIKSIHDKRVFMVAFDAASRERNIALMEQFEIALKRVSADKRTNTDVTFADKCPDPTLSLESEHRSRTTSGGASAAEEKNRKRGGSGDMPNGSPKTKSAHSNLTSNHSNSAISTFLSIWNSAGDSLTRLIESNKDAFLIAGIPVWCALLFNTCSHPTLFSIFIFCAVTTVFGMHYSKDTPDVDEVDDYEVDVD